MGERWQLPRVISEPEIRARSGRVLSGPDYAVDDREFIVRIQAADMDWDIGGEVFAPPPNEVALGPDGKRIGVFLIHGGGADHRSMRPLARLLSSRFGYLVATMTFPGQLYLLDPSRDWPGDTMGPGDHVRTPIYLADEPVGRDEYELVSDRSDEVLRAKYGTLFFLRAKPGSRFHARLAAWPMAFEEGMIEVCRRYFPSDAFSIYVHGHSTGGPFAHLLLQRVENIAGLVGMESSPFGGMFSQMLDQGWPYPFDQITVRTWRDVARYTGHEVPEDAVRRLPWLMEDVLEEWERRKAQPNIKAQQIVQFAAYEALEAAARATAKRLMLDHRSTGELVERFRRYPAPLTASDARPVPPLLYAITRGSRDHTKSRYELLLSLLRALEPSPRTHLVVFDSGVHRYLRPAEGLPMGLGPAVASLWSEAIMSGFFSRTP